MKHPIEECTKKWCPKRKNEKNDLCIGKRCMMFVAELRTGYCGLTRKR